jgi:GR25 family glycosyltransferase involved in LPS biosynthesis
MKFPWDNIYILNLKHQKYKFNKIKKSLNKNNITKNIERFIGVYGLEDCPFGKQIQKTDSIDEKWILTENMNKKLQEKNIIHKKVGDKYKYLRPGEIGHLLSFIKIMKDALKKKYKKILILEDDSVIEEDFKENFLKSYKNLPNNWDIVYLGIHRFHFKLTEKSNNINDYICDLKGIFKLKDKTKHGSIYGTHALLLNRKAMKAFVKAAFPLKLPSDVIMGQTITVHKLIKGYHMCKLNINQENYDRDKSTTAQLKHLS